MIRQTTASSTNRRKLQHFYIESYTFKTYNEIIVDNRFLSILAIALSNCQWILTVYWKVFKIHAWYYDDTSSRSTMFAHATTCHWVSLIIVLFLLEIFDAIPNFMNHNKFKFLHNEILIIYTSNLNWFYPLVMQ